MSIFSNISPLVLVVIILVILNIASVSVAIWMYTKMKKFLIGDYSNNISDSLLHTKNTLKDLSGFRNEMENYLTSVEKRLKKSVQAVHTVRFNPFKGVGSGGNQSFATAFLSEEGDGVVISSLYSRDHVSIFSKPIKKHSSEHELSQEEHEALDTAKIHLK